MLLDDYASDEEILSRATSLASTLCGCPRLLVRLEALDAPVLTIRTLPRIEWFKPGLLVFPAPTIHPYGLPAATEVDLHTRRNGGTHATLALIGLETFRADTMQRLADLISSRRAPRYIIATPTLGEVKNEARLRVYAHALGLKEWRGDV